MGFSKNDSSLIRNVLRLDYFSRKECSLNKRNEKNTWNEFYLMRWEQSFSNYFFQLQILSLKKLLFDPIRWLFTLTNSRIWKWGEPINFLYFKYKFWMRVKTWVIWNKKQNWENQSNKKMISFHIFKSSPLDQ
jgi:hypothetical protein